jgi:hypothetical protein
MELPNFVKDYPNFEEEPPHLVTGLMNFEKSLFTWDGASNFLIGAPHLETGLLHFEKSLCTWDGVF